MLFRLKKFVYIFNDGFLTFNRLGKGKVYYSHIDFGKDNLFKVVEGKVAFFKKQVIL